MKIQPCAGFFLAAYNKKDIINMNPWIWVRDLENPLYSRYASIVNNGTIRHLSRHKGRVVADIQQGMPKNCEVITVYDFSNFPTAMFWRFLFNQTK